MDPGGLQDNKRSGSAAREDGEGADGRGGDGKSGMQDLDGERATRSAGLN